MYKFYDLFMNFLKRQSGSCVAVYGMTEMPQISFKYLYLFS